MTPRNPPIKQRSVKQRWRRLERRTRPDQSLGFGGIQPQAWRDLRFSRPGMSIPLMGLARRFAWGLTALLRAFRFGAGPSDLKSLGGQAQKWKDARVCRSSPLPQARPLRAQPPRVDRHFRTPVNMGSAAAAQMGRAWRVSQGLSLRAFATVVTRRRGENKSLTLQRPQARPTSILAQKAAKVQEGCRKERAAPKPARDQAVNRRAFSGTR
jgi:hypothetical protein